MSEIGDDAYIITVQPNKDESLQTGIIKLFSLLGAMNVDCEIKRDYIVILKSFKKILKESSLSYKRPDLAAEFDEKKNGIPPEQVTLNSNRKYWWFCPKGHDSYQATPNNRNRGSGCPICGRKKALNTLHANIIKQNGLLKDNRPDLIDEIDDSKMNLNIDYSLLQTRDGKTKISWKCSRCGYRWITTAYSRTVNGTGCPSCSHSQAIRERNEQQMQREQSSLQNKFPKIAKEWHPTKNGSLTPSMVSYGSTQKVWWLCPKCGNEYIVSVNNRTSGRSSCPKCKIKRRVLKQYKAVQNIETGQIFESVKSANEYYGKKQTNISAVCRGERSVALGYHWKYIDSHEKK